MSKSKLLIVALLNYTTAQSAYVSPAWPRPNGTTGGNTAASNTLPDAKFTSDTLSLPGDSSWNGSSSSDSSPYGSTPPPAANNDSFSLPGDSDWNTPASTDND